MRDVASIEERTPDHSGSRRATVSFDMSPAVAFSTLVTPLAAQVALRVGTLCVSPDPESLHKLRVTMRRLRSLWWAYDPLIGESRAKRQRREFKALADSAGRTRDWDILKHLLDEGAAIPHSFAVLVEQIDLLRDDALVQSRATIAAANVESILSQRIADVTLHLDASAFDEPLAVLAARRIATAKKTLRKRMKHLLRDPHADYAEFHAVRIAAKKVRYLLEFFAPLIDSGNEIGVVELTQMQDELGALNDVVSSESLLLAHTVRLGERGGVDDAIAYLGRLKGQHMQSAHAIIREFSDQPNSERPDLAAN